MTETVTTETYRDNYGERILLRYRYNLDTNESLKTLGFPAFKWEPEKKAWSIQHKPDVIGAAIQILNGLGYDTSVIKTFHTGDLPQNLQNNSECWTKVKRTRLYLHWPYIRDAQLRDEVRLAVRSISGRKFHAEEKCWSIPLAQARTLHGLLKDTYEPLATAIIENEDVGQDVQNSIDRVSISGAAVLDDEQLAEINSRLEGKFPEGLDLYPFQKTAVAFAEMSEGRCLIGDEMGIGKTISAIGYASLHPEARPAVVVCPSNVKFNWKKELNRWLPDEDVFVVKGSASVTAAEVKALAKSKGAWNVNTRKEAEDWLRTIEIDPTTYVPMTDFIVINYDMMEKYQPALSALAPRLVILDESHYIKNSGSRNKPVKRTMATLSVARASPKVIALSGTAISSRPREFFNTLNLLRPDQFSSEWDFKQQYCDPWHNGFAWNFDGASNIKELNERTRDLCIRRLKSEVLPELPPKTRTFIPIELTTKARSPYDIRQEEWDRLIEEHYVNSMPLPPGTMLQMLNELRHICGQIKVEYASEWIQQYREQTGKPIVVFTHHRDVLKRLAEKLKDSGNVVYTISGDTPSKTRQQLVDDFQLGNINVLVCNTMAAKEGITLTAADTVVFLEREWTPTDEEQAEDRVYRIGQESQHVHAVYFSVVDTVDEHFDRVVEDKRAVVKGVLDGGDVQQRAGLVQALVKRLKEERGWRMK